VAQGADPEFKPQNGKKKGPAHNVFALYFILVLQSGNLGLREVQ
jgi:hypothetical protein